MWSYINNRIIFYIIVLLLCSGTLFLNSSLFIDARILPKWYALLYGLLLGSIYYAARNIIRPCNIRFTPQKAKTTLWIIIFCCTVQALYGILQYLGFFPPNGFYLSGSFDNPAGFAASLGAAFPFCLFLIKEEKKKKTILLAIFCTIVLLLAIVLSGSRAGMVSVTIVCIIFLWDKIRYSNCSKAILLFITLLIFFPGLYYFKKDSADGRFLIWQCSWNMFLDNPLGYGTGGFEANYMEYQAGFFRDNPDSKYAMLADTVQHPFNEYIRIATDYGIPGISVLVIYILTITCCYKKNHNKYSRTALLSILSIAVFSFFSYPFMYPFVWLLFLAGSYIILANAAIVKINFTETGKKLLCIICIGISLFTTVQLYERMKAEIQWCKLSAVAVGLRVECLFKPYQQLYPVLKNDRYFLYNYAVTLYEGKEYETSLTIAKECRTQWADYDLEILLAEIYTALNQYEYAHKHYLLASEMCPNRFIPLYKIVLLYQKMHKNVEARKLAGVIIDKPVKIHSNAVSRIKKEMENFLSIF